MLGPSQSLLLHYCTTYKKSLIHIGLQIIQTALQHHTQYIFPTIDLSLHSSNKHLVNEKIESINTTCLLMSTFENLTKTSIFSAHF